MTLVQVSVGSSMYYVDMPTALVNNMTDELSDLIGNLLLPYPAHNDQQHVIAYAIKADLKEGTWQVSIIPPSIIPSSSNGSASSSDSSKNFSSSSASQSTLSVSSSVQSPPVVTSSSGSSINSSTGSDSTSAKPASSSSGSSMKSSSCSASSSAKYSPFCAPSSGSASLSGSSLSAASSGCALERKRKRIETFKMSVYNLPVNYDEMKLADFLHNLLVELELKERDEAAIINVQAIAEDFAVIELSSEEMLAKLFTCSGVEYLGKKLHFLKKEEEEDDDDDDDTDQQTEKKGAPLPLIRQKVASVLDTSFEIFAFLHLCTVHKKARPAAKWETIYSLVIGDLDSVYGVITNTLNCEMRRKSLYDAFRRHQKKYSVSVISWQFYCAVALLKKVEVSCAIVGHRPEKCPGLQINWMHQPKPAPKRNLVIGKVDKVAGYSKGAFITDDALVALIKVMKDLGPRFDSIERDSSVWEDVKRDMASEGYNYKVPLMKVAYQDLVRKFRNYETQVMRQSGHGRVDWPLWDDMCALMYGNVGAKPLLTMAAGSSNEIKNRQSVKPEKSPEKPVEALGWQQTLAQSIVSLVNHVVNKK